jgi:deoxycytidine triphosphate deaminase
MFLNDKQLNERLDNGKLVIEGLDRNREPYTKESLVQPASIDLTIGNIYEPGAESGKPGSPEQPRERLSLKQGETAMVQTREHCKLPKDIGAIGFPPSSVSARGLLMTNPGHVDPGYDGHLSFTVINMGKDAFELVPKAQIVTVLFFELEDVQQEYGKGGNVKPEVLAGLSKEFLDVSEKARKAAQGEEAKTRLMGLLVPLLVAVAAVVATYLTTNDANQDQINALESDVATLKETVEFDERLDKLEQSPADESAP